MIDDENPKRKKVAKAAHSDQFTQKQVVLQNVLHGFDEDRVNVDARNVSAADVVRQRIQDLLILRDRHVLKRQHKTNNAGQL
jgi:hypothetical protein